MVRRVDVGELNIVAPLRLAVEVLSPSTRSKDLLLKRSSRTIGETANGSASSRSRNPRGIRSCSPAYSQTTT